MGKAESALARFQKQAGNEEGVGEWFQVDQSRIDAFADATLDHQYIHVDVERAAGTPFGGPIAHGYLTLALLPHLTEGLIPMPDDAVMAINYGLDRVRFISPVPSGARIRARSVLVDVHEVPGGLQFKHEVTIELEGAEKPAAVAETLTRAYF